MRIFVFVGLALLLGFFFLLSLGVSVVLVLPVILVAFVVMANRRKTSPGTELLALGTIEVSLVWFVWAGLYYHTGVSPANYLLADEIAGLLFVVPLVTFFIARRRGDRIRLAGLTLFLFLIGTIVVPFIPLGGACTGQEGHLHCVSTYGSASWLFLCAGGEYATPPGDVSTGLPTFPPLPITSLVGAYFFAVCASM
jgi:hypothetical protein